MSRRFHVRVNGESYAVELTAWERDAVRFRLEDREYVVELQEQVVEANEADAKVLIKAPVANIVQPSGGSGVEIKAPIPGVVVDVLVTVGERVSAGQVLLRIEAMKMQNSIFSPHDGTVAAIHVGGGEEVGDQQLLVEISA